MEYGRSEGRPTAAGVLMHSARFLLVRASCSPRPSARPRRCQLLWRGFFESPLAYMLSDYGPSAKSQPSKGQHLPAGGAAGAESILL